jgi:hypothetical protein
MGLAGVEAYRTEFLSRLRGADDSGAAAIALVPRGDDSYADAVRRAVAGFAAVRGIVPQLGASRIGWFDVARTDAGDVVAAANRRTGRTDHAAAKTLQSAGQPTVTVQLVGAAADGGSALSPTHLPEREATFLQLGREIGVPVVSAHRRGAGERTTAGERSGS